MLTIFTSIILLGPTPAAGDQPIWQPVPGMTWHWQLSDDLDLTVEAEMYDIDLFETPAETIAQLHEQGRRVVCYFSAGSLEEVRPDAGDFPEAVIGEPLENWPGERWLDIRRIDLLAPIMTARLDLAAAKGCDGVEPDNIMAVYEDSGFDLTEEDQIAYNRWLAAEAHARGLAIGLKNATDLVEQLVDHFDFAINEQCFEYDECDTLLPFIEQNKAVFGVEYSGDPEDFCPVAREMRLSWQLKDHDLTAWRQVCWWGISGLRQRSE